MTQTVKRLEELCYHSHITRLSANQIQGPGRTVVYLFYLEVVGRWVPSSLKPVFSCFGARKGVRI